MAVMAASNIICFLIGAKVGQKVVNGEEVELPDVNPLHAIRERRERQEAELVQSRFETIMQNIDSYNGTERGQKDVPGR